MPINTAISAIPLQSGKFGTPTIDQAEIGRIRDLRVRSQAASIMDHIKDWFCGTNRVKAKRCLYDMMKEGSGTEKDNAERLQAFIELKCLCAEPFKNNFKMWIEKDGSLFIGIAKDYQRYYHNDLLKNDMQFADYNNYNQLTKRAERRDEFDGDPQAMQALLHKNSLFPSNSSVTKCTLEHEQVLSPGLNRMIFSVTSRGLSPRVSDTLNNDRPVGIVRYHMVDIVHDKKKHLFISRVQETDRSN